MADHSRWSTATPSRRPGRSALGIALVYVVLAGLWLTIGIPLLGVSDAPEPWSQVWEWILVLGSGILVYALARGGESEQIPEAESLRRLDYRDSLTGLPNRQLLQEQAEKTIARAGRRAAHAGVVYLDLNRFRRINETLGHRAGDDILSQVGRRLQSNTRDTDTVARIGGDEFAVLLADVEGIRGALTAGRRLQESFEPPFFADNRMFHIDARLGIALYPEHGVDFQTLLSQANRAAARAAEDKTDIVVYEHHEGDEVQDLLTEREELRTALEEEQFTLHFQPVYRVSSSERVGAEVLVRWMHPVRGLLLPAEFIPLAEDTGLIRRLDRWVLKTAIPRARHLVEMEDLEWVAVNVSAQSLVEPDLVGFLRNKLALSGLPKGRLVLEVTESTAVRDARRTAEAFEQLRELDIRLAIDDFGTGHAALAYLKNLPADMVKVDMIFVRGIDDDPRAQRLLQAIVGLAQSLDVQVVAEGVETKAEFSKLQETGCDLVQGFYLSRPVPEEQLPETVHT